MSSCEKFWYFFWLLRKLRLTNNPFNNTRAQPKTLSPQKATLFHFLHPIDDANKVLFRHYSRVGRPRFHCVKSQYKSGDGS